MRTGVSIALTLVLAFASAMAGAAEFPRVEIKTTAGSFVVELDRSRAPLTVENFLQYASEGHYDGTIFHRVINNFVIQGGGFTADLKEKSTQPAIPNESGNGLRNERMTIAMARTGEPHTADSQFYINLADNAALDPKATRWGYAVFGRVVDGFNIIDDIGHRATVSNGVFSNLPDVPVVIEKVTLVTDSSN
jgi:peptidyl-prolyl cis-trans isomerase A (cyclophilin A)